MTNIVESYHFVHQIFTLQSNTALLAAAFCWAEALETVIRPDLGSTSSDLSEKVRDPSTGVRRSFMASLARITRACYLGVVSSIITLTACLS